ncbi:hypothetical protein MTR67_047958 [Solanum verrucosum]|uniref:RNase H type-1 domain-containing protein n=1 Tax=Solanum verrucosum TaxID=315347 RepID=A0AAF0ZYQ4_SOLVR|nr:hypothetical protein MTR67_047958 [Solanum verrucosum]
MTLLDALKYIKTTQLDKVIIETVSLVLKNIVERVWKVPWKVVNILEEIWKLMQRKTLVISHIFREWNKLADYLANLALEKGTIQVNCFQELESQGNRIVTSDKLVVPYLRIRQCRK